MVTDSGTGTRILAQLGEDDMTVTELLANISTPSGKKTKRHQLKHWLNQMFKRDATIEKASGTNWATCTWSEA